MTSLASLRRLQVPRWGLLLLLGLIGELTFFTVTTRHFAGHGSGMLALSEQFAPTGVLAMGLAMVILTGSIDLSVGANASLAAVVAGTMLQGHHGEVSAVLLALVVATAVGLLNGLVIAYLEMDSLLVTLATQFIVGSIGTSLAGDSPPYGFSKQFQLLGTGRIGFLPVDLLIFLGVGVATILLVGYTTFGRTITLTGYNAAAARYTGLRTRRSLAAVFLLSGTCSGIAGILLAAYYNDARADTGTTLLLPAITVVVLGGVDIFGGRGRMGEVIVAVFLLGYLTQGLLIAGYSSLTVTMVTGLLLIGALVLKVSLERDTSRSLSARLRRLGHSRLRPHPSP